MATSSTKSDHGWDFNDIMPEGTNTGDTIKYNATTGLWEVVPAGSASYDEIQLTPKPSSSGGVGTVYYDSDDDHLWVATNL